MYVVLDVNYKYTVIKFKTHYMCLYVYTETHTQTHTHTHFVLSSEASGLA
jgi:hypothetical protein